MCILKKLSVILISILLLVILAGCSTKVDKKPLTISTNAMHLVDSKVDGIFTGTLNSDKQPEGIGRFECPTSKIGKWTYDGEFKNGSMTGKGKLVYPDDDRVLEGVFNNGILVTGSESKGKKKWTGSFENGKLNGVGAYARGDGYTFEGKFIEGVPDGEIKIKFYDEIKPVVNFANGLPVNVRDYPADFKFYEQDIKKIPGEKLREMLENKVVEYTDDYLRKRRFSDVDQGYLECYAGRRVLVVFDDDNDWKRVRYRHTFTIKGIVTEVRTEKDGSRTIFIEKSVILNLERL